MEQGKLVEQDTVDSVSYTHLDVYKRQGKGLRGLLLVFDPSNHTQHRFGRKGLVIQTHRLDDVLHDALGVLSLIHI